MLGTFVNTLRRLFIELPMMHCYNARILASMLIDDTEHFAH